MSKAMSLKARIRNIAKEKNIPAQVILQNYMFERLLVRLSVSGYKEKFIYSIIKYWRCVIIRITRITNFIYF